MAMTPEAWTVIGTGVVILIATAASMRPRHKAAENLFLLASAYSLVAATPSNPQQSDETAPSGRAQATDGRSGADDRNLGRRRSRWRSASQ